MKNLHYSIIAIAFLAFSGTILVFAQPSSSHVMGKFSFSPETENLMMRSCGKINDLGDVDPQVIQFVKQNNPNVVVSNDNAQELFWNTLYTKFVSQIPEFKSLGGKNDTITIQMGGTIATSCPPIQGGNATFQVNGNQLTYRLGFYSDAQAFYYKSITFIHTSQNQTLLENPVYPMGPDFGLQSPLKQLKAGIASEHIQCKIGLAPIIKSEDRTVACVKPQTAQNLMERGWGVKIMWVQNTDFAIDYSIIGGRIVNATANFDTDSMMISLHTTSNGNLTIDLPRGLIDSKKSNGSDEIFSVLVNGAEADYREQKQSDHRNLTFAFANGTTKIEIIPYCSWAGCRG